MARRRSDALSHPPVTRSWAGRPAWPTDPLGRVRLVVTAILVALIAVMVLVALSGAQDDPLRLLASGSGTLIGLLVVWRPRRTRLFATDQGLLVVLVTCASLTDGDLQVSAGLAQAAMAFAGLYASVRPLLVQFLALQLVLTATVVLKERVGVDAGTTVGSSLLQAIALLVMASLTYSVVHVVGRYAEAVTREKLLYQVGTELAAAPTRPQVYAALMRVLTVLDGNRDLHVIVAACEADGLVVIAESAPRQARPDEVAVRVGGDEPLHRGAPVIAPMSPRRLSFSALPEAVVDRVSSLADGAAGGATSSVFTLTHAEALSPAPEGRAARGTDGIVMSLGQERATSVVLLVTGPAPLGDHVAKSLHSLEPTAALALRNADLTEGLRHQAKHDFLTGLLNRAGFTERLTGALTGSPGLVGGRVALLFLDLDGFKAVNDQLGHAAGDELLVAVADRLSGCTRETDGVARLGGDEFVVLVHDVRDERQAAMIGEQLRAAVTRPVSIGGHEVSVGVSVGVALADTPSVAGEELLARADAAMYAAKVEGKRARSSR